MEDNQVEKGLLTFYSFLKKIGEDKEFLEVITDLKEAWDLLNKFFEIHREKINKINEAIQLWHGKSDRDIKDSVDYIKKIPHINKELSAINGRILKKLDEADKLLYDSITKQEGMQRSKELKANIKQYIKQIEENFSHLSYLYKRQKKYLKSKTVGQIEEDLKNYSFLYRLLTDEAESDKRLKINIKNLILAINIHIGKVEQKKQRLISSLRVEEILDPNSSDLQYFYKNIMKIYFPIPSELDTLKIYKEAANYRYHKKVFGYYCFHILLIKAGTEVVGGLILDFLGDEKKEYCLAVPWFTAVKEEYRSVGFKLLINEVKKLTLRDKQIGGYKDLVGAFFEVEDVNKVPKEEKEQSKKVIAIYRKNLLAKYFTAEEIQYILTLKPSQIPQKYIDKIPTKLVDTYLKVRERLYRQMGAKLVDITYIQPQLDASSKPLNYLKLYLYPMKKEWQKEIPSEEFLKVYDILYECYSSYYKKKKDPTYKEMVNSIRKKKVIKLV